MVKAAAFIILLAGALAITGSAKGQSYAPKRMSDATEVCVQRLENDGVLNIIPVTITVTISSQIKLIGGQAGCLFIYPGTESISLTYPYPYGDPQRPRFWTTTEQYFKAKKGEVVSFTLCEAGGQQIDNPSWALDGWHKMWLLNPDTGNSVSGCADY